MENIDDYRNDDEIDDILEISLADMLRNPVRPRVIRAPLPPPPPPPPRRVARRVRENQTFSSCEIADFLNSAAVSVEKKVKMRRLDNEKTEHETQKNNLLNTINTYRYLLKEANKQLTKLDVEISKDKEAIIGILDE